MRSTATRKQPTLEQVFVEMTWHAPSRARAVTGIWARLK